jgi:hypothetical protein
MVKFEKNKNNFKKLELIRSRLFENYYRGIAKKNSRRVSKTQLEIDI